MVVMFFYWVYSYIRKQRNNARSTEEETLSFESIIRGIVLLISLAGPFCAGCYLAVFGTYWFCFFKFQDVPYVFLPPYINDVERHSNVYIIILLLIIHLLFLSISFFSFFFYIFFFLYFLLLYYIFSFSISISILLIIIII